MKEIKIFLIFFVLLIVCCKKNTELSLKHFESNIDTLLLNAQNENLNKEERLVYLSRAKQKLLKSKYDTEKRDKYYQLAAAFFINDNEDTYHKVLEYVKDKSFEYKDTLGIIQTECQIANYNIRDFKIDSAYYYLSAAERLSQQLDSEPFMGTILLNKADLEFFQKDFAGAEVKAVEALKIATNKKDDRLIYDCYITIGNSLAGTNNFEKAVEYYRKSISKTENLEKDPQYFILKAQPYNYIGKIFQKNGRYKEALKYVDSALCFGNYRKIDPVIFCYLTNNKAYSKFKLGDDDCLKLFNETLKIGDSLQSIPVQLTSKLYLSEYYLSKKDIKAAKRNADEAQILAHANKVFEDELKALELLAKIDPKNDSAYDKRYITLNDSLQNVERATRNKFARIEFETDEITNQKNLAEAENGKLIAQRWMILGFSLFSITLIILFYISRLQGAKNRELHYLQKQQLANAEIYQLMLDQQQKIEEGKQIEQRRISKELHDGIMGKLTAIRLNLFVLGKKTDPETVAKCLEHVDEIQEVEKEVRKISHDLSQNLFADVSDFTLMVTNLVEAAKGHSQLQFKLITDENIDWNTINSVVKMQVYRILQEALHNIRKYAKAKSVCIRMSSEERLLTISITDDGIGFDPKAIKPGIGHKNMRERASEINGELTIWSEIGKGTQINLKILT